ncbi:hypothetical protein GGI21_001206 [Coemansia aciculifera]|nr:hypothetical protein GGI21_001206 [Coemansia aciculifera]
MTEPQTPTTPSARYGLRTRTPIKPAFVKEEEEALPTPRKRGRPTSGVNSNKKAAAGWAHTPTRGRGRGRGRLTSTLRGSAESSGDENPAITMGGGGGDQSTEDESYGPASLGARRGARELEPLQVNAMAPAAGRRRGRPRKSLGVAGSSGMGRGGGAHDLSELVGDMALVTPQVKRGSGLDVRRFPVHLSKHDAFRGDQLADALRIMQTVPVGDGDDRYELKKMSDAIKMCGYELPEPSAPAIGDVYRLLAWAVHSPQPGPAPEVSEEVRALVLRVFADVGRRIRMETRDLAAYHRRHVLRKLLLAEAATPSELEPPHAADNEEEHEEGVKSPRSESAVHRRNPLRVPGPLVDIWKLPLAFKKAGTTVDDGEDENNDNEE